MVCGCFFGSFPLVRLHVVQLKKPLFPGFFTNSPRGGTRCLAKPILLDENRFFKTMSIHFQSTIWKDISGILKVSYLTYLPHKAVAEVSKDKEPIGRGCVEFKWFESQLMSDSNELRVKWFGCQMIWDSNEFVVSWFEVQVSWLSIDLSFKWFGCQLMRASNDFGCLLNWTSSEVVVNWFEIQAIWLSIGLRFKWVGCQLIWDSKELVVNCIEIQVNLVVNRCVIRLILFVSWFEIQVSWLSIDLRLKWFGCQSIWDSKLFCETSFKIETLKLKNKAFLRDFLQNWNFEAQEQSFSARPPSKLKLWSSKIEAFVRDFLQKWSFDDQKRSIPARFLQTWNFEDQKRSISARLPSKLKLWSSKTKPFCETSFKNLALKLKNEHFYETSFKNDALKLKNEAFVRDFLQNWSFEDQKRSISARLLSKLTCWADTSPQNSNTF